MRLLHSIYKENCPSSWTHLLHVAFQARVGRLWVLVKQFLLEQLLGQIVEHAVLQNLLVFRAHDQLVALDPAGKALARFRVEFRNWQIDEVF